MIYDNKEEEYISNMKDMHEIRFSFGPTVDLLVSQFRIVQ